jgi:hypothetical protein
MRQGKIHIKHFLMTDFYYEDAFIIEKKKYGCQCSSY